MNRNLAGLVLGAVLGTAATVGHGQDAEPELTTDERVERLERELAGLETRFEARTTARPSAADGPARGVTLSTRVDELERRVAQLASDLTRVERQAAAALREASQARRDATAAERIARDAQLRAR